jgi:signal transduction histidine kinase
MPSHSTLGSIERLSVPPQVNGWLNLDRSQEHQVRRRILGVAVVAVIIAEVIFALPLAIAVQRLLVSGQREELERQALREAVVVSQTPAASWAGLDLQVRADNNVGLYDKHGRRIAGRGPVTADPFVIKAEAGDLAQGDFAGEQASAVPVFSKGKVVAVVRAYDSRGLLTASVWVGWAGMLVLAVVAALIAAALARRQARRLTEPLLRLEHGAEELGSGNFAVTVPPSDVGEIDRAAGALNRTATRLGDLMAREQNFAAYASHQIQTPLTALRLSLESALADPGADPRSTVRDALATVDRLAGTVDDVLMLTRGPHEATRGPLDVRALLEDVVERWRPALAAAGRELVVGVGDDVPSSRASIAAARQVLDVLVANALSHGRGTVSIMARDAGGAMAIDVTDEGTTKGRNLVQASATGWPSGGHGTPANGRRSLGLGLAQGLTAGEGGRLLHAWTAEQTRFTVLLPSEMREDDLEAGEADHG